MRSFTVDFKVAIYSKQDMQERHQNKRRYFKEQGLTTKKHVIPYIEKSKSITKETKVLEIGCGEAGNLQPFIEMGCDVTGVDISSSRIKNARIFTKETHPDAEVTFIASDIYKVGAEDIGQFDIIILRDVIEHIPNQDKFLGHMKVFLKPDGCVFFGFPPWYMPFGGHQQTCHNKWLSKVPYFHLLPTSLYKAVLRAFNENEVTVEALVEIKETGISTARFEKIMAKNNYKFIDKTLYLINPNYEIKFGLKKRPQFGLIKNIPFFRDFVTTCYYCLVTLDDKADIA